MKTLKNLVALLVLVFVFSNAASAKDDVQFATSQLTLHTSSGDYEIIVEVAKNAEQRQRGLMFRTELTPGHGMIFDFGASRPASMWMANTLIPLDMVFIKADGTISGAYENAEPHSKRVISSSEPVRYVLELGGGQASTYGLKPSDRVIGPALDE